MAIKQSRGITIGKGTPQRLEGQNGDMSIRSSRKGLKLYVKESNKWHSVDLDIDLRGIASTVRKLEDEVKRLSTKTNNTPVVDKLLLRQSGGASSVGIQNKSGNIAFRNSTDTADGKLQSVPFDIGTNNSSGKGWGQFYYDSSSSSHYLESNGLLIVTQLNAPDATEQASILMMSKEADSIVRFNEQVGSKFIMGYDHLKADGSTSDARFKIDTGGSFSDDSVFNLDANGTYVMGNVGIGLTAPTTKLDVEGTVSYKHTAFSTTGPTDSIDVSDTTVLEVDTSSNNVTIGGFSGGVQGQVLYIVKTDTTNFIQLEHNESPAAGSHQKIFLTSGADERVVGYGGYTLYCNGTNWFSLSNPTGAADAG